jgi:hypothetical protein
MAKGQWDAFLPWTLFSLLVFLLLCIAGLWIYFVIEWGIAKYERWKLEQDFLREHPGYRKVDWKVH